MQNINWFPGHMAKTRRLIQDNLQKVDLLIELFDARIPVSSRNPELTSLAPQKPRLLLMSKADLASEAITQESLSYYRDQGHKAFALDLVHGSGMAQLQAQLQQLQQELESKTSHKGRLHRPLRAMVLGIPNSGKSTFINSLAGRNAAKSENKPGVTRSIQWVKCPMNVELMDMPGVLWPNLGSDACKLALACTGAIRDEILNLEELAFFLFSFLKQAYPRELEARYDLEDWEELDAWSALEQAAKRMGCLKKGGLADTERFAKQLIYEFRQGKIGSISLESAVEGTLPILGERSNVLSES